MLYVRTNDGRKKVRVWVWLALLAVMLGISILLVRNSSKSGIKEMQRTPQNKKDLPVPMQTDESSKAGGMDVTVQNEMEAQLSREQKDGNGYLDPEREKEIRQKYAKLSEDKQKNNFTSSITTRLQGLNTDNSVKSPKGTKIDTEVLNQSTGYKTFDERIKESGATAETNQNKSLDFQAPTDKKTSGSTTNVTSDKFGPAPKKPMTNMLPLGTFIPCVLDGDIVTNTLQSHVWANVVLDVTFRRQLQLPKGLVRLRGETSTQPVQNVVDVYFDTMVFSDGTELRLKGFAYAAFDARYPHRFRTRGIPGELIVPPMWVKIQSLIYTAALGASDAYIQNYIDENSNENSSLTPSQSIDPITGETSITYNTTNNKSNQNLGATLGLGAGQKALESLVGEVQKDLEKYQPYLIVEKGTPLFVQLDETIDIGTRQVDGTRIGLEEEQAKNAAKGINPNDQTYAPGDARAKYVKPETGYGYGGASYIPNGQNSQMQDQIKMLQDSMPKTTPQTIPSPQSVQNLLNN